MPTIEELEAEDLAPKFPLRTSIVTRPAPLIVSESASNPNLAAIDVLVSASAFARPKFTALTIAFKARDNWDNDAADVLTPAWNSVVATLDLPHGWTHDTSDPAPGRFRIIPQDGGIKPNDAVRLRLDQVPVSATLGVTNVTISLEVATGDAPDPSVHQLGKFPRGFTVEGFRADDPVVEHGEATAVRWKASGGDNVDYRFYVNGTERGDKITSPFHTGPLHGNSTFQLVATMQVGPDTVKHAFSTAVQVNGGDITAHKIHTESLFVQGSEPLAYETTRWFKFDFDRKKNVYRASIIIPVDCLAVLDFPYSQRDTGNGELQFYNSNDLWTGYYYVNRDLDLERGYNPIEYARIISAGSKIVLTIPTTVGRPGSRYRLFKGTVSQKMSGQPGTIEAAWTPNLDQPPT